MKTHDDSLFRFIKGLTASQKRNFSRYAKRSGGSGEYLKLFENFEKMDEENYDESELAANFNNYSHLKSYLFDKIVESIKEYDPAESADLMSLWHSAFVMRAQWFHEGAYEILKAGIITGENRESHIPLLQLLELEAQIIEVLPSIPDPHELIVQNVAKRREYIAAVNRIMEYDTLLSSVRKIIRTRHVSKRKRTEEDMDRFREHPAITIHLERPTKKDYILRNMVLMACDLWEGNFQGIEEKARIVFEVFETNPQIITEMPDRYFENGVYLITALEKNNKREESQKIFAVIFSVFSGRKISGSVFLEKYSIFFFVYLWSSGRTGESEKFLEAIQRGINFNFSKLNPDWKVHCYYVVASYYFEMSDLANAKKSLSALFSLPRTDERLDLQIFARLMELLIYIEENDIDFVETKIKSFYRFIESNSSLFKLEEIILNMIKSWVKLGHGKEFHSILKNTIKEIEISSMDKDEAGALNYLDVIGWIKKQLVRG